MKKITAVPFLVLAILFCATAASPCGDKLLHLSRIHRQRAKVTIDTVLVFARPGSILENAAGLHLEKAFQEEGYNLVLVSNDRELELALQSGVGQVVIVDIADASHVGRLPSAAPTMMIPVISKSKTDSKVDDKSYPAVIRFPAKAGKFLDALDRAFDSKWGRQSAGLLPPNPPR